MTGVQ